MSDDVDIYKLNGQPNKNRNLHKARKYKNDEFYTKLEDIERELRHYRYHFKNKTVFCNCDDPWVSNFFHYFTHNFDILGIKKLITTCYQNDQMKLFSRHDRDDSICLEYDGPKNGNKIPTPEEIGIIKLKEGGDFRSKECIELLKQSDIVCTNPPFSLFREYMAQLIEYGKKFLIIGNYNAVIYKEIFPLIKDNKIWLGVEPWGMTFNTPEGKEKFSRMTKWFTNLHHNKRNDEIILVKKYNGNEEHYPKYDNYDAIDVDKVLNIPKDYNGIMGVPITFFVDYNPNQFKVLGFTNSGEENKGIRHKDSKHGRALINGKEIYTRILIQRK